MTTPAEMDYVQGFGEAVAIAVASPAAGASKTYTVGGSIDVTLLAVCFKVVTDGNAANRIAVVSIQDTDGIPLAQPAAPFTIPASTTTRYTFGVGVQQFGANAAANIGAGIPEMRLSLGMRLVLSLVAVQAGDAISEIRLAVVQHNVRP